MLWTEHHLPASTLAPLRQKGDALADEALAVLQVKVGQDALEALRAYTSRPVDEQESDAPRKLMEQLTTVPEWVDWKQIQRGQDVFCATKVTKVLISTGYLSGHNTRIRIIETALFLLNLFQSLKSIQPPTSCSSDDRPVGWESIVQVRLLHAAVRTRLSRISRAHSKFYNIEQDGVPINQEDLVGTLFVFSSATWRSMALRMGLQWSIREQEDYLHFWRYIGYLIGVEDSLGVTESPKQSQACFESIYIHLSDPSELSGKMCVTLLSSIATLITPRKGSILARLAPDPFKVHMAMAQYLFGPVAWAKSGLPPSTRFYRFLKNLVVSLIRTDVWLASHSRWWLRKRNRIFFNYINDIITREIGASRVPFKLKAEPKNELVEPIALGDVLGFSSNNVKKSRDRSPWLKRLRITLFISIIGAVIFLKFRVHQFSIPFTDSCIQSNLF
ncbi:hypothetical protein BGZ94_003086 [Podila epigama]|nr:hypothetical protein BGZ94_003086 [Podila epigama]